MSSFEELEKSVGEFKENALKIKALTSDLERLLIEVNKGNLNLNSLVDKASSFNEVIDQIDERISSLDTIFASHTGNVEKIVVEKNIEISKNLAQLNEDFHQQFHNFNEIVISLKMVKEEIKKINEMSLNQFKDIIGLIDRQEKNINELNQRYYNEILLTKETMLKEFKEFNHQSNKKNNHLYGLLIINLLLVIVLAIIIISK